MSCGDFLKEYSKEYTYATSCSDLDEVLIGGGYMKLEKDYTVSANTGYYSWLFVMDDDIEEYVTGTYKPNATTTNVAFRPFYGWAKEPFMNPEKGTVMTDVCWSQLYAHIALLNVVISQVGEFTQDPESMRRRITGEAQFLRGAYYYLLNNIYAKPYNRATAETDLGVALKLTEYVDDHYYKRSSNAAVYQQIVQDLKDAADNLVGVEQSTIYRANEIAARTLLSRVYLYMGEWQAALDECDKVIALGCHLQDLNSFKYTGSDTDRDFALSVNSPEIIFSQGHVYFACFMKEAMGAGKYRVSEDLGQLYRKYAGEGVQDLRLQCYLSEISGVRDAYYGQKNVNNASYATVADEFALRASEVYLNKAEAEAMLNKDGAAAVNTLTILLKNRFKDKKIPNISHLSGKELIQFIREERRREFCFEGQRWFDLRRYAVYPEYPEKSIIVHPMYDSGNPPVLNGTAELKMGEDPAWVMPIPDYEIEYNKGELVQNEQRIDR